jgi:uncharacterized protein YbaP (TraB family)
MQIRWAYGAAIALAISTLAWSQAQQAAPPPVSDWSIETVIVTARQPGPAFWHIKRGNSEVFILGTLGPLPKDLKWETGSLDRIISGARVVLLPPRGQVGLFEGAWFLITQGDVLRLPDGQKLEQVLSGRLKQRFLAARNAVHRDADRYAEDKPSVAGFRLEQDFLKANDFALTEPNARIEGLAATRAVPSRHIATYPALDVIKEVPALSSEGNFKCLADSLDDIDVMSLHARLAARAWADGDLDGIKAHYSEPKALDCLGQSATFTSLWANSVKDTVAAVNDGLGRSGKMVIVINVGELLRRGGVLERLKAQGLAIEGPGD